MLARKISAQQFEDDFSFFYEAYYYNDKHCIISELSRKDRSNIKKRLTTIDNIFSGQTKYYLSVYQTSLFRKDLKISELKEKSGKYSIFKNKQTMLSFLEDFFRDFIIESIDNIISQINRFNFPLLSKLNKYKDIIKKDAGKFIDVKFNDINPKNKDLLVPEIYDEIIKRKKVFQMDYENEKTDLEVSKIIVENMAIKLCMKNDSVNVFSYTYSPSSGMYMLSKEYYGYINNILLSISGNYKVANEFYI